MERFSAQYVEGTNSRIFKICRLYTKTTSVNLLILTFLGDDIILKMVDPILADLP
jgi:hypothetical protein